MTAIPPVSPGEVVAAAERLTLSSARTRIGADRFKVVMQSTSRDETDEARQLAAELLLNLTAAELLDVVIAGAGIAEHMLRRLEEQR